MSLMLLGQKRLVANASAAAPAWGSPINITDALITSNGSNVFDGLVIENTSYSSNNGAAIYVTASQPVIIQNCIIRAQHYGVSSLTNGSNITVRNCLILIRNTTQAGQSQHRSVNLGQPQTLVVENNTFCGGGVYLNQTATGGSLSVRIRYNRMLNIDSRISDGAGGYIFERANTANVYFSGKQFCQFNGITVNDAEIAWNEVLNTPFVSRPEDTISMYAAVGTVETPINIHDNFVRGGCSTRPYDTTFSGCGIVFEDASTQYINCDDNQVVGYANVGIGIANGSNMNFRRNRLIACGRVNGLTIVSRNRAAYSTGGSSQNIVIQDTAWSWVGVGGAQLGWYITNSGNTGNSETGTYSLGATTTEATEAAERAYWLAKVAAAGVRIGSTLEA